MCSKHSFIKFKCKVKSNMNNTHTIYTKNTVIYKATLQYAPPHSNTYGFIFIRSRSERGRAQPLFENANTCARVSCRLYSKLYCFVGTLYIRNTTSSLCAAQDLPTLHTQHSMPPPTPCRRLKTKRKKTTHFKCVGHSRTRAPVYIWRTCYVTIICYILRFCIYMYILFLHIVVLILVFLHFIYLVELHLFSIDVGKFVSIAFRTVYFWSM